MYASALVERFGATLDLVHVEDVTAGTEDATGRAVLSIEPLRKRDEHALRKFARRLGNERTECHVPVGCSIIEELLRHAEATLPQILCMGTQSPKGFHRLVFGFAGL